MSYEYTFPVEAPPWAPQQVTFTCAQSSCGAAPGLDGIATLYDADVFSIHPDPITSQFAAGDFMNFTFVNLLVGSWDRYPLGIKTWSSDGPQTSSFTYLDMLAWPAGGELEIVSDTLTFKGHSIPESSTILLFPAAILALLIMGIWKHHV
jgi:hypothetical protein